MRELGNFMKTVDKTGNETCFRKQTGNTAQGNNTRKNFRDNTHWGPNRIKGGLRRGKCQRDKQALQEFLGRLQLDNADVVYKSSKTPRPCCRAVERACFGCARSVALVSSINMARGACKCGVGSLVHRRLIGVTATWLFCALVFPSVGQDLRNNQTKAGYPAGFGRAFQPFVLLS